MNLLNSNEFVNSRLESIKIDIDLDEIELKFYWPNFKVVNVSLKGILYCEFKPDFTEEPPWLCIDFMHDEISSLNDITEELLFKKESKIYEQLNYPIFRFCTGSADFYLNVIHQNFNAHEELFNVDK
ncbi:hypothetical protein [Pseudoalteromonas luteoviolacea]|uniref:Uncharacterized protein n=1 Tax=Pseudoalteromonas luteoviolacea (strain 2ta16) TaxID=1353533 RepID=V4JF56_PSEL2|nr:hypothetical protein [Pseudoalteromonas luteoviolacea]ESP93657.1 hypothetical protein PL2TA16_03043 [Pseudoalteromonas luteoviolacea 2ta16]KZN42446.1 hypothetical protein N483_13070 [Pseudoalteromonas luteoviolacea NCIMB 1944]